MHRNRTILVVLIALVAVTAGLASAMTSLGDYAQHTKVATIQTCGSLLEGSQIRMKGGAGEGYTKLCTCVSDGAASPAYQWCSEQFTAAATTYTCAGGSATVCP